MLLRNVSKQLEILISYDRRKKEEGRRKREEGRRKKIVLIFWDVISAINHQSPVI
ncbi:hypothetical protein K4039_02000 [Lyngbya sp. CCAP 1446/10]|uniref:hypothetical protein n=1 Tax=Microcoleaceae TaxID=1892252 RepID=UPI00223782CC|nr:hypothetical protein [Lyngbya sp. CCAP 1446/10]MCW6048880.1 hypothetical protein [Lyngbya sp. CCAP 1446/10]